MEEVGERLTIVLSGLLRVVPREPKVVPDVLTLVRKDWEGEAWRSLEEEGLEEAWREGRRLEVEGDWRLARRAPNPPAALFRGS